MDEHLPLSIIYGWRIHNLMHFLTLSFLFHCLIFSVYYYFFLQRKTRMKPSEWKKLSKTPKYKDDNVLRDYQLEGVNWLTFSWCNGWVLVQYAVKAQTSLAPLSCLAGSRGLMRMCTNIVYFRVMRRLYRREWNWLWYWLCVNLHPWQRSRDHGVWRLTLTAYWPLRKG